MRRFAPVFLRDKICVDPGFGFGKTLRHNVQLVNWLAMLHGLGVPTCLGQVANPALPKCRGTSQQASGCLDRWCWQWRLCVRGVYIAGAHVAETAVQALAVEQHLPAGAQDQ